LSKNLTITGVTYVKVVIIKTLRIHASSRPYKFYIAVVASEHTNSLIALIGVFLAHFTLAYVPGFVMKFSYEHNYI